MSAEIQAEPDLRVNYRTRIHEDGGGREQSEVEMLDDGEQQYDNGSQNPETANQRNTPAVNKIHFTVFKVSLGVMYLLFLAGVILRATLKISELKSHISQLQAQAIELNSSQLQSRYDILSKNHSQLMDEVKKLKSEIKATLKISELKSHISQLQAQDYELNNSNEILSKNHSQLMDKVKELKKKNKAMELNSSQLQSRYDILSKNHSQLMDEVKKLKSEIKDKWCPVGWTTFGASCYFKSTERKTWSESRKDCQDRGADLVIINSKEEQEFVSELGKNTEFWIGLKWTQRGWEWWDGTSPTATSWGDGWQQSYNVVCCNYQGKWTTTYFTYTYNWICEK